MKERKGLTIPYFLHEGEIVRMERVNRRLWIVSVIEGVAVIITALSVFIKGRSAK